MDNMDRDFVDVLHDGNTEVISRKDGSVEFKLRLCCSAVQSIIFTADEWTQINSLIRARMEE